MTTEVARLLMDPVNGGTLDQRLEKERRRASAASTFDRLVESNLELSLAVRDLVKVLFRGLFLLVLLSIATDAVCVYLALHGR